VAPLFCRPGRLGPARWGFLGVGTSLRSDVVAVPGREAEVAAAVARCLADDPAPPGVLSFDGVPSDAAPVLARHWPARTAWTARRFAVPAPFVDLAERPFDEWLASRSSNLRQQLGRNVRRLEKAGGVFRFSTPDDMTRDLASFWDLHHRRWEGRGGSDVLSPDVQGMLVEAAHAMVGDGRLLVFCLDVDGRTISVQVFLAAGRRLAYWLGGFDEDFGREQPALTSLYVALERTWADFDRLDLGGGGQPYKYRLADGDEELVWSYLAPAGSWRARATVAPMLARHALARRLPHDTRQRVKRLLRR